MVAVLGADTPDHLLPAARMLVDAGPVRLELTLTTSVALDPLSSRARTAATQRHVLAMSDGRRSEETHRFDRGMTRPPPTGGLRRRRSVRLDQDRRAAVAQGVRGQVGEDPFDVARAALHDRAPGQSDLCLLQSGLRAERFIRSDARPGQDPVHPPPTCPRPGHAVRPPWC